MSRGHTLIARMEQTTRQQYVFAVDAAAVRVRHRAIGAGALSMSISTARALRQALKTRRRPCDRSAQANMGIEQLARSCFNSAIGHGSEL